MSCKSGACQLKCLDEDLPKGNPVQILRRDHPGTEAVVKVVGGICQFIGHIADLGFQIAAQLGVCKAGHRSHHTRIRA